MIKTFKQRRWQILLMAAVLVSAGLILPTLLLQKECPRGMALVGDFWMAYCIDKYEEAFHEDRYVSRAGKTLWGVSWQEAREICEAKGMWLCTSQQWEDACDGRIGEGGHRYPYGDQFRGDLCNTPAETGKARRSLLPAKTGAFPECVSAFGVFDMSGNHWEWTDPSSSRGPGEVLTDKRGGAYYTDNAPWAASCKAGFKKHPPSFIGTTSFRCCAQPRRVLLATK